MSGETGKAPATGAVFLFDSTHDAMKAEETIIDAGFWCDVVPRPPDTSSELCGLAVEVQVADQADVAELLSGTAIRYEIYQTGGS
jgi:hypothetical protein